jgi:hypothetical protein
MLKLVIAATAMLVVPTSSHAFAQMSDDQEHALGDRDRAKNTVADARRALAQRPDDIKRIDDLVKGLGLEG